MNFEVPEPLQATRDLLIHSLPSHPQEQAPPVPQALMDDFGRRFAPAQASAAPKTVEGPWLAKLGRFFASPAFGLAAAAVLVLGLVVPQLISPAPTGPETFRATGSGSAAGHVSRIVFVGESPEFLSAVKGSEVFEPNSMINAANLRGAMAEPDPKVVVDFGAATLSVFNGDGEMTFTEALPKSAEDLPAAIAAALTQL